MIETPLTPTWVDDCFSPHINQTMAEYGVRPHAFHRDEYHLLKEQGFFQNTANGVELLGGTIYEKETDEVPYRFTAEQLYKMLDLGLFPNQRVELIDGDIIEMAAQKNTHAIGVSNASDSLSLAFIGNYWVRVQMTLDLSPLSSPDPDVAVVSKSYRIATAPTPASAFLVVEVSDRTLRYDQRIKSAIYAASGILDYWILNLVDRQLEIYRDAQSDSSSATGKSYASRLILDPGEFATPLAATQARIAIADLLP